MKKLSVFLLAALSIALFSCNKDNNKDENTEQIVRMTTNVTIPDDDSKSGIDGYRIKWDMDDKFYTFGTNRNDVVTEFIVHSIDNNTGHANITATYDLNLSDSELPRLLDRSMFFLGGFEKTKEMPQLDNEGVAMGMSIAEQTGKFEDIGNYQVIQTMNNPLFKLDEHGLGFRVYDFDRAFFISLSSIVKLDLSEYANKYVTVSYENEDEGIYVCNAFEQIYYGNQTFSTKDGLRNEINEQSEYIGGDVSVMAQDGETYLVLLPQTEWIYNTEMVFSVDGEVVGRVNFPNGIKQNRIYTGPNGDPIRLGAAKAEIEEVAIY